MNINTPPPPNLSDRLLAWSPWRHRRLLLTVLLLLPGFGLLAVGGWYLIHHWPREHLAWLHLLLLAGFILLLLALGWVREKQLAALRRSQRHMILGLANLAELRDPDTGKHLERTRSYGVILARQLARLPKYRRRIDENFIGDLYEAAPLHDLGKVAIPDRVLLKPDRLDDREFAEMQRHSEIGARIIERLIARLDTPEPFILMSYRIARHHHEKFNGRGYPDGLRDEEIPLEARIYALGDAYDAIRAKRPYKGPVTHLETVQRLYEGRGNHFDPDVVNAFLDCEEHFMEVFEIYQDYDEIYLHSRDGQKAGGAIEPAVVWNEEFEVGVEVIDRQHRELISRINRMLAAIRQGKGHGETLSLVRFLQDYVVEHFQSEEIYMRRHHYPDYDAHKEIHDTFVAELAGLVEELEKHGIQPEQVVQIHRRVINWVVDHIFLTDKALRHIKQEENHVTRADNR